MNTSFQDIFNILDDKFKKINNKSEEIKKKFNDNKFIVSNDKLELILDISKKINELNDKYDDLHNIIIESIDFNNLTTNEKIKLREAKINKKINDIFLPYILYAKICLENENNI